MSHKPKLFFIVSRFPYPLTKGDKLRAFHQIRGLSETFDVYLCALTDEKVPGTYIGVLKPFCAEIMLHRLGWFSIVLNTLRFLFFSSKPIQAGYFYNAGLARKIKDDISRIRPDHIYCQLIRTAAYAIDAAGIPKTLDYMDALSAGMERRSESASGILRRLYTLEADRLRKYEHALLDKFDNAVVISESDRNLIFHFSNEDIKVVPNGVDLDYFRAVDKIPAYDLLFTGNLSYPPNVMTVHFLVGKIMPLVWKVRPRTTLLISGANPSRRLLGLSDENVKVSGWIEDIRKSYASASVFIAPMLIGSGLQNKLLEAMAMKLPCITSELANRALGAETGTSILVGRNAAEYAGHIIELLENKEKAAGLAEKGYSFVTSNFSWEKNNSHLSSILKNVTAQGIDRRGVG